MIQTVWANFWFCSKRKKFSGYFMLLLCVGFVLLVIMFFVFILARKTSNQLSSEIFHHSDVYESKRISVKHFCAEENKIFSFRNLRHKAKRRKNEKKKNLSEASALTGHLVFVL